MAKSKGRKAAAKDPAKPSKPSSTKPRRNAAKQAGRAFVEASHSGASALKSAGNGAPGASLSAKAENQLATAQQNLGTIKSSSGVELTEKVKELLRLAQEQGYLTYNDINDALPDNIVSPEELDEIYIKLRNLDVEIVDQAEVDRVKQPEPEEEEDKSRLDILDDPVRMYLKQMGQVPLLTREQEVEISKRIETAENELKRIIYSFGFSGKEHIALAEKLISEPPKERFDRVIVDKKIENRENHLKDLRKLVKVVRALDQQVDDKYSEWQHGPNKGKRDKARTEFLKLDKKLQDSFPKFYFKQKVIEEMALVAENIHDKIQLSLRTIDEWGAVRKSGQQQQVIQGEQ